MERKGTVVTKKAQKAIWGILLAMTLTIGLTLTAVFASSTTKLEIGGIDILTDADHTVPCGTGKAVYDPDKNTLTLNQATIEYPSGNMAGIYTTKEDLTIILKGKNKVTSGYYGVFGGKALVFQGDGTLTVESAEDSLYADTITIDGTTVGLTSQKSTAAFASTQFEIKNGSSVTANAKLTAIQGNEGVQISGSTVQATSNDKKGIYSDNDIAIDNHSYVVATSNYNTIWGDTNVKIQDSKVDITSNSGMAIYSNKGDTTIERSFVKVTAPDDHTIVSGNYLSVRNSWLESFNGSVDNMENWTVWENVVSFQNKVGIAMGNLSIPADVEVSKDMVLTIPDGASITVPAGKTFTNHGTIELIGNFSKEKDGTVICDSHTGGESTCTQAGNCGICGQEYGGTLSHNWEQPEWKWSEDGKSCEAEFTCSRCKDTQKVTAEVSAKVTSEGTCTQKGTTTYTAEAVFAGKTYTDTKELENIPALGHQYGEPEWKWSEDGESCETEFMCSRCKDTQKVTAEVRAKVTSEATCTQKGTTTYTAEAVFAGKTYTDTKELENIPALGHQYGEPEWKWSEDGESCQAEFTCSRCKNTQSVTAEMSEKVTSEATCTQKGTTTYTAEAVFAGKTYTDTKELENIPALGHQYGEPEWKWSEDGESCETEFMCSRCKDTQKVTAEVRAKVTSEATCTQKGTTTYTAEAMFAGKTYTDTKKLENIPALGHQYENGKCTVCGAADPSYKPEAPIIIGGANAVWGKDGKDTLLFTSNAEYSTFQKVLVDGKELDERNYDVKEGSTIVTLKPEYLDTLSIGKHTLAIVSESGTAQTTFTITAKPITGDTSSKPEKDPESSQTGSEPEKDPESSQVSSEPEKDLESSQTGSETEKDPESSQTGSKPEKDLESTQASVSPEKDASNSNTGNNNYLTLWIGVLFLSGMGAAGVGLYRKNKEKNG